MREFYPLATIHCPLFLNFGRPKGPNNFGGFKSLGRRYLWRRACWRIPLDRFFRKRGSPKRRRRKLSACNVLRPHGPADGSLLAGEVCLQKPRNSKKPGKTALSGRRMAEGRGQKTEGGGQKAEDRRRRTVDGGWRLAVEFGPILPAGINRRCSAGMSVLMH